MNPQIEEGRGNKPLETVVLVVGDEPTARALRLSTPSRVVAVSNYLEAMGEASHRVVTAVVGAVEAIGHDMEAVTRAIRQIMPGVRTLIITDADREPQAMRAVRLGFDDYLVRPIDPRQLLEMIPQARP